MSKTTFQMAFCNVSKKQTALEKNLRGCFSFSPESGFNSNMLLRLSGWKSSEESVRYTVNHECLTYGMLVLGWTEMHGYWMRGKTTFSLKKRKKEAMIEFPWQSSKHWRIGPLTRRPYIAKWVNESLLAPAPVEHNKELSILNSTVKLNCSWNSAGSQSCVDLMCASRIWPKQTNCEPGTKQTVWETKNHPWQVEFIPSLWPKHVTLS